MGKKVAEGKKWAKVFLFGITMGLLGGLMAVKYKIRLDIDIWVLLPTMVLALYGQILIHELGHLVFGRIAGFRLYSFRVFGFVLDKENGRYALRYRRNIGYGGLCMMLPTRPEVSRRENILYFAGGLLMNLFTGAICLLILLYAQPESGFAFYFLAINCVVGLLLALTNALPYTTKGNYETDGKHILRALRNDAGYKLRQVLFFLGAKCMSGIRPGNLGAERWDQPEAVADPATRVRFMTYGYYHHLDLQQYEEAMLRIKMVEQHVEHYPTALQHSIKAEIAFAYAFIEPDEGRARSIYEGISKQLDKERSVSTYRIRAAYAWHILNDVAMARTLLDQARSVADSYVLEGFIPMEKALLNELSQRMEAGTVKAPTPLAVMQ